MVVHNVLHCGDGGAPIGDRGNSQNLILVLKLICNNINNDITAAAAAAAKRKIKTGLLKVDVRISLTQSLAMVTMQCRQLMLIVVLFVKAANPERLKASQNPEVPAPEMSQHFYVTMTSCTTTRPHQLLSALFITLSLLTLLDIPVAAASISKRRHSKA
jgi:hypothetical protein